MRPAHLLPVLLLAAPLARAEDCALEAKAIKPQFAAKLPKGFKLASTKKDKRLITQVLKTPDGFEVTLTLGGCEHVGYALAIKGGTLTPKTVGAELVAVSKRVLPTLPMDADALVDPKLFLKAIDEANIVALPAELPCGDATCKLSIGEEEKPKADKKKPAKKPKKDEPAKEPPGVLKLEYDFAL
ncbi:MAG: hypothetical protein ACOZQL_30725 [Myxococcota bacterium]